MVSKAVEAASILAAEGIRIRVVDMFTIKPLDKELIENARRRRFDCNGGGALHHRRLGGACVNAWEIWMLRYRWSGSA
jgi:hypothetical protein